MTRTGRDEKAGVRWEVERENEIRWRLGRLLDDSPIPDHELVDNLALYLRREPLTDLLSMNSLYQLIVDIPGIIVEFGVQYGRNLGLLTALRSVYEPYNPHRRIVGFDTFEGFPMLDDVDVASPDAFVGGFAVPAGYVDHLHSVLDAQEAGDPIAHIQRTFIIEGEVGDTLPRYLERNPHTTIALAYFDMDLYTPTRQTLLTIQPYLTRGSVVAFDEFADAKWPGETTAMRDAFGLDRGELRILPGRGKPTYFRWT